MTQETYEVLKGSIKVPTPRATDDKAGLKRGKIVYFQQGEKIPPGTFSDADLADLESQNLIRRTEEIKSRTGVRPRKQKKGKWSINPDTLAGKDQEELLLMVVEIDQEFDTDTLKTKQQTIAQLTKDFDPEFDLAIATASDKTTPGFVGTDHRPEDGIKDLGDRPMSDKAREGLERARSKARPA